MKWAHINTLEFLASIISIWVDILNNQVSANDCFLSQTDSMTAAGWLRKSNFSDSTSPSESSVQLIIARKLATLIMESSTCLYSQWFPGYSNNVADALSRDQHSSNHELSSVFTANENTQCWCNVGLLHPTLSATTLGVTQLTLGYIFLCQHWVFSPNIDANIGFNLKIQCIFLQHWVFSPNVAPISIGLWKNGMF